MLRGRTRSLLASSSGEQRRGTRDGFVSSSSSSSLSPGWPSAGWAWWIVERGEFSHHSLPLCHHCSKMAQIMQIIQVRKNRERRLAREEEEMAGRLAEERRQEDGLALAIRFIFGWLFVVGGWWFID